MQMVQPRKRVVLISWKTSGETEVFSNLKNFSLSYPEYNYNTLNNYLSKAKTAFENELVRIERKNIIVSPKPTPAPVSIERKIIPILRRVSMKDTDNDLHDLQYWLSKPVNERAKGVTFLVSQMLKKGQRMDKTAINKIKPGK